jgi:hypothetical protein
MYVQSEGEGAWPSGEDVDGEDDTAGFGLQNCNVLVAEDNPFNLEVVKTFLENENENTTVAWASNGKQALEM